MGFDKIKLNKSISEIRKMTTRPFLEIRSELINSFIECGIYLSLNPKLTNSCVNGASRWIGNNILIQISDTHKKEDIFWFTLFHEIGHTLKHLPGAKKSEFVDLENGEIDVKEIEADEFAIETLIPKNLYQEFVKRNKFDSQSLKDFAREIQLDVGILAGRMCKDKAIAFNYTAGDKFRRKLKF